MKETKETKSSEIYDSESDVYYVSFESGEPSYVEEIDDVLLIELGIFTNMPTGFRILNYKRLKTRMGQVIKEARKAIEAARKEYPSIFKKRENQVTTALQRALA